MSNPDTDTQNRPFHKTVVVGIVVILSLFLIAGVGTMALTSTAPADIAGDDENDTDAELTSDAPDADSDGHSTSESDSDRDTSEFVGEPHPDFTNAQFDDGLTGWEADGFIATDENTATVNTESITGDATLSQDITLSEESEVTFNWKWDAAANESAALLVDDSVMTATGGSNDWMSLTTTLDAGEHTITFAYIVDDDVNSTDVDGLSVDSVTTSVDE